jgi:hypothetical protein
LSGYFQPTEFIAPEGVSVRVAHQEYYNEMNPGNFVAGLLVGQVYRLEVSGTINGSGIALYPTVELIDRLYPPPGEAARFPVPIELTRDELDMAARGMFVTRVIYVEDPMRALPTTQDAGQPWFEAGEGEDPLQVADQLGRPIAILRLGGRDWSQSAGDARKDYGSPPFVDLGYRDRQPVPPAVPNAPAE